MAILQVVQHPVSCAPSALRYTVRAAASKKTGIRRRIESTHCGTPSTSELPSAAVPDSLDTGRRRQPNRTLYSGPPRISTLDHTRLTSHNFLDLSGQRYFKARAYRPSGFEAQPGGEHWRFLALRAAGMDNWKFPPHARGFLYHYLAPNAPALSGQVRFRVTGTNDPALFSSGEDLLRVDHLPWRIPVLSLPLRKYYTALLRRLSDDGLVSEHVVRAASRLPPNALKMNVGSERVVHALCQPFPLHFGLWRQAFYFVGADTVQRVDLAPIAVAPFAGTWVPTVTGSALCRFEKSPRPEHAGRRVVVCRAVRILEPMKRAGVLSIPVNLLPREGELIRMTFTDAQDSPEWTFDIDHHLSLAPNSAGARFAAGLDLLYDNEVRAGGPVGW